MLRIENLVDYVRRNKGEVRLSLSTPIQIGKNRYYLNDGYGLEPSRQPGGGLVLRLAGDTGMVFLNVEVSAVFKKGMYYVPDVIVVKTSAATKLPIMAYVPQDTAIGIFRSIEVRLINENILIGAKMIIGGASIPTVFIAGRQYDASAFTSIQTGIKPKKGGDITPLTSSELEDIKASVQAWDPIQMRKLQRAKQLQQQIMRLQVATSLLKESLKEVEEDIYLPALPALPQPEEISLPLPEPTEGLDWDDLDF